MAGEMTLVITVTFMRENDDVEIQMGWIDVGDKPLDKGMLKFVLCRIASRFGVSPDKCAILFCQLVPSHAHSDRFTMPMACGDPIVMPTPKELNVR